MHTSVSPLVALACLSLSVLTGCAGGGEGEGEGEGEGDGEGSFHAVIDGVAWDASPEHIDAGIVDFGSGPKVNITASNADSGERFNIQLDEFTGELETTDVEPLVLRFTSGDIYEATSGALSITRSGSGDDESFSGTFSGSFSNVTETITKVITDGTFTTPRTM